MSKTPLTRIEQIDRLLIVKSSSIGDVVHATPVVEAIKKAKPSLTIGWVVRKRCADVLRGNPVIAHLHIVENKPSLGDLLRLRRDLRAERYQCALDMQGLFLSGVYTWLSGAPIRIGIDRNRENNAMFLTHPVVPGRPENPDGPDRHAVDILYGFAEALGVKVDHPEFEPQAYLAEAGTLTKIDELRSMGGPKIALNVGASSTLKQWPVEHWVELAHQLVERGDAVVFVGDKRDADVVREVQGRMSNATSDRLINFSGQTNLRQLAAVLQACDVVVTGDTGPMHIAVAVGTPTVALFGSTNPDRTGPYGKRNLVIDLHLPCSPCYRNPTCAGRIDCMRQILPEMALKAVEEKLRTANA